MGKQSRDKGRRGERAAKDLLTSRDWTILADTSSGLSCDDLVCQDPDGRVVSVEVKNTKMINIPAFVLQARTNAKKNAWLLLAKIPQTSSWLVMGKGRKPVIWHEQSNEVME